jgi:hypothetical protein
LPLRSKITTPSSSSSSRIWRLTPGCDEQGVGHFRQVVATAGFADRSQLLKVHGVPVCE